MFIFTSSFLNCCNQAAIWYNCTVIANYWIMGLCVCVCVLVKVTLESTICSVSCLLRLPLNLEEKCVKWRPSEHLMAQLACLLCVCVWEAAAALASDSTCFHQKTKATQSSHCTYSPNPSLLLPEVKTGRGVHVWNSLQIFTDLWLCLFNTYRDMPWF